MLLNGKTISHLTEDDLQALIDTQRQEDQFIDFKGHSYKIVDPRVTDPDEKKKKNEKLKTDLCTDVCAFANAYGGWVICGMAESDGAADSLVPLKDFNTDQDIRRLREVIDSGIEPRVAGVDMRSIPLKNGGETLAIYVPRSFNGPHRVAATHKFEKRRLKGNGDMDMQEIRQAFLGASIFTEQIRAFRQERVAAIQDPSHPKAILTLEDGPLFVVHLLPLGMIDQPLRLSFRSFAFASQALSAMDGGEYFLRHAAFNLDGVLLPIQPQPRQPAMEYFQVFRSGAIEYAEANSQVLEEPLPPLSLRTFEIRILQAVANGVRLQRSLGINEPSYLCITVARTRRFSWTTHLNNELLNGWPPEKAAELKQDPLLLPEIYVESWNHDPAPILKTVFDLWANALGWRASNSYDSKGNWIAHPRLQMPSID